MSWGRCSCAGRLPVLGDDRARELVAVAKKEVTAAGPLMMRLRGARAPSMG